MINPRIHLLINTKFINFAGPVYAAAKRKEELGCASCDLNSNSKLRSKGDYFKEAVVSVNQMYDDFIKDHDLSEITLKDLERCWRIVEKKEPDDVLGLIYTWVIRTIALYIPSKSGNAIKVIPEWENRIEHLFKEFINWVERTDRSAALTTSPTKYAYIDEVIAIFDTVMREFCEGNPSIRNVVIGEEVKNLDLTITDTTTVAKLHVKTG
jgi:hypothetical protein